MEIFKYTQRQYERTTLERGEIRIGTLEDYRKGEQHGSEIGDSQEGKVVLSGQFEDPNLELVSNHPALNRLIHMDGTAKDRRCMKDGGHRTRCRFNRPWRLANRIWCFFGRNIHQR